MAPHKSSVVWSPEALDDIDRLWTYYAATAGHVTADKLLREVGRIVATIDDFPLQDGRAMKFVPASARSPPALKLCSIA